MTTPRERLKAFADRTRASATEAARAADAAAKLARPAKKKAVTRPAPPKLRVLK